MKFRSIILLLSIALSIGISGCKSRAGSNSAESQPATADAAQPNTDAAQPKSEDKTAPPSGIEPVKGEAQDSLPRELKPLPALSSKGATRVEMRNIDFHTEDPFVMRIRSLRGAMLRRNPSVPVVFDDKRSFVLRIDAGTIGIRTATLAELMNNYVFAYPKAPLKKIEIGTKGKQIKISARMHKVIDVPVRIVGDLTPTVDGKIRLHPTSIKAAGIPVTGFLHLFGADLSDVMRANEARGVRLDGDDIIFDQERMIPPPYIRGRITAVRIEGDEVVQDFGGGARLPSAKGSNYMYYRGGVLRFGKLTMNNADLRIIDADPKTPFDFSIDHYNTQLVAGHSKNTPSYGLVVYMPDYNSLRAGGQNLPSSSAPEAVSSNRSVKDFGAPARQFEFDAKNLFPDSDELKLEKDKGLKDVGVYLEKNAYDLVVVRVQNGTKATKAENQKLAQSRALVLQQRLNKKYKVNESRVHAIGNATNRNKEDGDKVIIAIYSSDREKNAPIAKSR